MVNNVKITKPKVSVVVPVYNTERYLEQCLNSLCNQTLKEIEIICVDDGSSDNSVEILEKYKLRDDRFKILHHENDGHGAANARNMGLEIAEGEYIIVLDADDFFELSLLEKTYSRAKQMAADLVIFNIAMYNDVSGVYEYNKKSYFDENIIPDKDVFCYKDISDNALYQIKNGVAWNMLVKADLIRESDIRFFPVYYNDDLFYTFTVMASAKRITVVNEVLVYYRVNVNTSQTQNMDKMPLSSSIAFLQVKEWLEKNGYYDDLKKSLYNIAVQNFRYFLENMKTYDGFSDLYEELKNHTLIELNADDYNSNDYLRSGDYEWYKRVKSLNAAEYMNLENREKFVYSTKFKFPYEKIERKSSVVLYGAGGVGKALFVQNLVRPWCNIVAWIDKEGKKRGYFVDSVEMIHNLEYDAILVAIEDTITANQIKEKLISMEIEEKKIVLFAEDK